MDKIGEVSKTKQLFNLYKSKTAHRLSQLPDF